MVDLSPTEEVVLRALTTYTEAVNTEKQMIDAGVPEGNSAYLCRSHSAGFIQELPRRQVAGCTEDVISCPAGLEWRQASRAKGLCVCSDAQARTLLLACLSCRSSLEIIGQLTR